MGAPADDRDLVDELTEGMRDVLPDLDQPRTELARRSLRITAILEDQMSELLSRWGLTRADYSVLIALWSAGEPFELAPGELTRRLLLTSGGVSGVLNRLEQSHLIDRHPHPADRRSSVARLTADGERTAETIARAWDAVLRDVFRKLPDELARTSADALRHVLLALGDVSKQSPSTAARRRP